MSAGPPPVVLPRSRPVPAHTARLAAGLAAVALSILTACAVHVTGTPVAAPQRTIDGARLERDVQAYLASDPATADLAAAGVECPRNVVPSPTVLLFCQVVQPTKVSSIPVTVLDADGNYVIGKPL